MARSVKGVSMAVRLILICFIFCCILINNGNARPPWMGDTDVFSESAPCSTDDDLLDLCQRCAKLTKSGLAYSKCCSTDMRARNWCSDFVFFGRGEHDFY